MAAATRNYFITPNPPPTIGRWGPTHSADSADTSVANNTSFGSRLSGQSGNNNNIPSPPRSRSTARGRGYGNANANNNATGWSSSQPTSSESLTMTSQTHDRTYDEERTYQTTGTSACGTFSTFQTNLSLAPSTNTHQLQWDDGAASQAGGVGCAADLRSLWRNAVAHSGRNSDRSNHKQQQQKQQQGGRRAGYQRGTSLLDYVTGCGQSRDASFGGRSAAAAASPSGKQQAPNPGYFQDDEGYLEGYGDPLPSSEGMEIDQFGNPRTTRISGLTPQRKNRSKDPQMERNAGGLPNKAAVTLRELAALGTYPVDTTRAAPAAAATTTTPKGKGTGGSNTSPRDVRDYWNGLEQQEQREKEQQERLEMQRRVFGMDAANAAAAGANYSGGGGEGGTATDAQSHTTGGGVRGGTFVPSSGAASPNPTSSPTLSRKKPDPQATTAKGGLFGRVRNKKKNKKTPRSAKYRLAETDFDTGDQVDHDDAGSVNSFLNVEMLPGGGGGGDADGTYRHRQSVGGHRTKQKDAVGRYRHHQSLRSSSMMPIGVATSSSALADNLSDHDQELAAQSGLHKQLLYQERVRTLGMEHQMQQAGQRQNVFKRSSTAPPELSAKARPSLARITSGDEYDDKTAIEEMHVMKELYRGGAYANIPLPPPSQEPKKKSKGKEDEVDLPFDDIQLTQDSLLELRRTVSELTMRSSYGEMVDGIDPNRRMAYYAVGRERPGGNKKRPGGNRRCYFTGRAIVGRNPFFAGTVQQGLRTLVVFCLPSAIGLPRQKDLEEARQAMEQAMLSKVETLHKRENSGLTSFITDDSDADPNEKVPPEILLESLPEPDDNIIKMISQTYAEQYETLPAQVQDPSCWKLYEKFCHFSGLPIAVGEVHYRVRPEVLFHSRLAKKLGVGSEFSPSDDIILSHEVMLACNGEESSEIIRLPNTRCFRYLHKHYPHQCSKLSNDIFDRGSWEMIKPEV